MAENCLGLDSWAWIPNSFSFETQALTKALQVSLSDDSSASSPPPPIHILARPDPIAPASGSNSPAPRRTRNPPGLQAGRISKRKSRASRRATTTFITADPANFRAMVQQVTGARFGPDDGPVLKPEPVRAGLDRVGFGSSSSQLCCLPTLDTSAFLLDRVGVVGPERSSGPVAGFEFEPVLSFPTLDSWGAM
ncbi:hypothetical protein J5N97_003626 [Dioscorea zingiberensis]|uniref:VQ domain-containing protein n=1 Tax=Dioscorea zingiberensis TaxID=325984 RepID=A0A9D5D717_9LILI|nr:hypothetical protein J5N97_003626 [Dioscorea zingiberensis]